MRLLFVADGRSPIARNWIRFFTERGDEVYLASTFRWEPDLPLKRLDFVPVAFSALRKSSSAPGTTSARTIQLRTLIRQYFGPLTVFRASRKLRALIQEIQPDLVHAMRIPYEGMLAADACEGIPLLVSVWGNDFTLHARSTPLMRHYTNRTVQAAAALHADCRRDIRLAHERGLKRSKPTLVIPGNGGIRMDVFHRPDTLVTAPVIIQPRGLRVYICNEAFFKSIPLVLAQRPDARFICTAMEGEPRVIRWIQDLGISHAVDLYPLVPYTRMAELFRGAQIVVSPSVHDGTPNSLLEAMACSCFPVAGDLESIREWIRSGENGLLIDPASSQSIADAVLQALENNDLRQRAAGLNGEIIASRAEYTHNMQLAAKFYEEIIEHVRR